MVVRLDSVGGGSRASSQPQEKVVSKNTSGPRVAALALAAMTAILGTFTFSGSKINFLAKNSLKVIEKEAGVEKTNSNFTPSLITTLGVGAFTFLASQAKEIKDEYRYLKDLLLLRY